MSDPILEAKTVAELMAALDEKYELDLPRSFPEGTVLGTLWEEGITVTPLPSLNVLYTATGNSPVRLTLPPKGAVLSVEVEDLNSPPKEEE